MTAREIGFKSSPMIFVVEGISAAGKTTYTRQVAADHCIPEFEPPTPIPGAEDSLDARARFWTDHNICRFEAALAKEKKNGFALCDTDPLKTHYDWCMARAGFAAMDLFEAATPMIRKAIGERRLGFADRYLVKHIEPTIARAQKEGDATRTRRRFDMHLALQPHLMDWFEALAEVLPGRVQFCWPETHLLSQQLKTKAPEANPRRFDVSVLDALLERLPR